MKKYLRVFGSAQERDAAYASDYYRPWVAAVEGQSGVTWNKPYIKFVDPEVKRICVENFSSDGDVVTYEDAAAVTAITTQFAQNSAITSFDELVYFTGLKSIGTGNGRLYMGFRDCSGLKRLTFPNANIPNIQNALRGCSSLERIEWTTNKPVIASHNGNFQGCSNLTRIDLPSISSWYEIYQGGGNDNASYARGPFVVSHDGHIYVKNVEVTQINFPSTMTAIQGGLFMFCVNIDTVTVPDSVTSIGPRAFQGCTGLRNITIPSSVTSMGDNVFKGCTKLTNLILYGYGSCVAYNSGNGTGILYIGGNVTESQREQTLMYKYIIFDGDVTTSVGNNMLIRRNNDSIPGIKGIWIKGNLTGNATNDNYGLYYTYKNTSAGKDLEFVEIMGTISSYRLFNKSTVQMKQGGIVHLGYTGGTVACSPDIVWGDGSQSGRIDKVYVGDGSSQSADQAVLNTYLADTDWQAYSDKLATWWSYDGEYKTMPDIPTS